ncbi:MAG: NADH-quinone oxidoreductase subunit J [Leptolinea sp.]|nr:NADH-quinone oxidoreductase subunit J [Leptolinea sp.]
MIFFSFMTVIVIGTSIGMLVSRNAVYSALFLVLNFASVAVLYITLGAPFIAMAQVTVYAGAIMILFLFVIMLLGAERLADEANSHRQRILAVILVAVFLTEMIALVLFQAGLSPRELAIPASDFASPAQIGLLLFGTYLLPFEITSLILLVAIIGAIVLTKPDNTLGRRIHPGKE